MAKQISLKKNLHELPKKIIKNSHGKKRERTLQTKWLFPVLRAAGWDPELDESEGTYIVHEEMTGVDGRVDIALKKGKRVFACIEVKAPNVHLDEFALKQAVKYASSYYYVSEGVLNPVLAICTNGLDAFVMDPALENAYSPINSHHFDLRTENGLKRFLNILKTSKLDKKNGSLPVINTKRKFDPRPYASNTIENFEKSVFNMVDRLMKHNYSAKAAVEMAIQCLLLAASRDNGIIPNSVIRECRHVGDWKRLAVHCNRLFGDVFEKNITGRRTKHIWETYDWTSDFMIRLDILPAQYMGTVYEKLISRYFGNKTSFYTPEEMIDTVLEEVKPSISDSILDPTCGSGAFLSKAIDYAIPSGKGKYTNTQMLNFFSNIVGVDKDPIACRVAKVTLLCTFMRKVGEQYRRSGKPLPTPKIQPRTDFFDWKGGKFSIILGNPPWESIDKLPSKRKLELSKEGNFSVYEDKNDVLCYVVEKSLVNHLKPEGKFAFVIKQQALLGNKYKKFCKFLDHKVRKVYDYGNQIRFDNYAQSSIIVGSLSEKKWDYIYVEPLQLATVKQDSSTFDSLFSVTRGAQTGGGIKVFEQFAEEFPEHDSVMKNPHVLQHGGNPKRFRRIACFFNEPPKEFMRWINKKSNEKLKKVLESRAAVKRTRSKTNKKGLLPYSWKWNTMKSSLKDNILVTERNLTPGYDRFPFYISKQTKCIPMDNQTVISQRNGGADNLMILGALMVSSYFVPLTRGCKLIPRREGGIFFNPNTVSERMVFPHLSESDSSKLINMIKKNKSKPFSKLEIEAIDAIFEKYFIITYQKNETNQLYSKLKISSFLQPNIIGEQLDLEIAA